MKIKCVLILLILILVKFNTYSQWIGQTVTPQSWLLSVYFTDIDTGYTVGGWNNACVYKTVDSGVNWSYLYSDTSTSWYLDVFFDSPDTGYVIGGNGVIAKTMDGGTNWIHQISGTTASLTSISCPAKDTCFIVGSYYTSGSYSIILKTTNGGNSWQTIYNGAGSLNNIDFVNTNVGYVVGSQTLKTTDGGNSWIIKNNDYNIDVSFVNKDTGYTMAYIDTVRKTTDGGNTWTNIFTNCNEDFEAIQAINENIVVVACSTWVSLRVLRTTDGGITWNVQQQPGDQLGSNNLFFLDENNGWLVGHPESGIHSIYKTSNGGNVTSVNSYPNSNNAVLVYPNPVHDIVNTNINDCEAIEIDDVWGKRLFYKEKPDKNFFLNITEYNQGIYFIKFTLKSSTKIEKILKL